MPRLADEVKTGERMSFPLWAPKELIEELDRLRVEADRYRRLDAECTSDESEIGAPSLRSEPYLKNEAANIDELANTLFRLLTNNDMQSVWKELSRPVVLHKPSKEKTAFLLWNCVTRALSDFQTLTPQAQTPKSPTEKRNSLLSLEKKAKALLAAIATDPTATRVAEILMEHHLTIENFKYRESMGDTPSPAEYETPLRLSSDCNELQMNRRRGLGEGDTHVESPDVDDYETNCYWDKMPLDLRLTYWAKEAKNTNLIALLQLFADTLHVEADRPPEIKQPGRKGAAMKPFLIRRLNEHMVWCYGQPLDVVVARIVSIVLDLPTLLTRDDVRPYIADPGKKSK